MPKNTGNGATNGHAQQPVPRLTKRQLSLVQELAQGYDIATVAERRGRGLSATYELADRVCNRLGLAHWQQIGPYAVERGLQDSVNGDRAH